MAALIFGSYDYYERKKNKKNKIKNKYRNFAEKWFWLGPFSENLNSSNHENFLINQGLMKQGECLIM